MTWHRVEIHSPNWTSLREVIDWALDQKMDFQRETFSSPHFAGKMTNVPDLPPSIFSVFSFDSPDQALLFKLTWGGI